MTHSKAPWTYEPEGYGQYLTIRTPERKAAVARVSSIRPADAALIAAAPDLLEALQDIVAHFPMERWTTNAEIAIAKATGEQE